MRLHLKKKCNQRSFRYFFQIEDTFCSSGEMRSSFVSVEKNHTVNQGFIVKFMSFSKLCGCQSIWSRIMGLHLKKTAIKDLLGTFFRLKISFIV